MTDALLSLIITATLLLGSPGPVPIALAAAGATVGFKRGFPFMCGMLTGLALVITLTFVGLAALFKQFPLVSHVFMVVSSLFLFYIAYKIATSETLISTKNQKILTYKTGVIINILNPKAYAAMVALITQFNEASDSTSGQMFIVALTIYAVAIVADTLWLAIGHTIQPLFNNIKYQHWIRYSFSSALALIVAMNLLKTFV